MLSVENLSIRIKGEEAVKSSSFFVERGKTTAIIGESGSGKTLSALAVVNMLPKGSEKQGCITYSCDRKRISLLLQDSAQSLNPVLSIAKQMKIANKNADITSILKEVELEGREKSYPFELSGGMKQKAMLALALSRNPELLIADEIMSSLDDDSKSNLLSLLSKCQKNRNLTLLMITHDMKIAQQSDRIAVMIGRMTVEDGITEEVLAFPRHPYTRMLLKASDIKPLNKDGILYSITGKTERTNACPFAPSCPQKQAICKTIPHWHGDMNHRWRCFLG